jgi:hypothetical protein
MGRRQRVASWTRACVLTNCYVEVVSLDTAAMRMEKEDTWTQMGVREGSTFLCCLKCAFWQSLLQYVTL